MSQLLFSHKQGATLPTVKLTLTSSRPYNLGDASLIEFRYRKDGVVESTPCTLLSAAHDEALLAVMPEMVDTVGQFECHVKVVIDGQAMYFPHVGFDFYNVTENF